jgi:hypothetical protein
MALIAFNDRVNKNLEMRKRVNARQPAWAAGDRLLDRALGRQDEKPPIADR